jgi:hypothetical protein
MDIVRRDGHEHTRFITQIRNEEEAMEEARLISRYSNSYYKDGWVIFSDILKFKLTLVEERK